MTEFALVPGQVQVGEHRETLTVEVREVGTDIVTVSLLKPGKHQALRTVHSRADDVAILTAIQKIADEVRPALEREHRNLMRAKGYAVD